MPSSYGNRQKHESRNPVQRWLIGHFHSQLADLVRALQPSEILDVGCGEGYVLAALRARGISCPMIGIDRSREAIESALERVPGASFRVQDAEAVAEAGERYDVVLMTEVLEHIAQPAQMLPVLERVVGRFVVLSVPWEPFFRGLNLLRGKHLLALGNDPEHVNHWSRGEFLRFVAERFTLREAPLVFPWTLALAEQRR